MSNAVMPLLDYKNTCDKIREKTASTDNIKSGELADKVAEVYEKGKQDEYDRFWDSFQENGERKEYQYAFGSLAWNDETFKPKYDFNLTNLYNSFRQTGITNLEECLEKAGVKLDTSSISRAGYMAYAFAESSTLTVVPEITIAAGNTNCNSLFFSSRKLSTIRKIKLLNETATFNNTFVNCEALENIVFEGVIGQDIAFAQSTKLTLESAISIVSHLSDTASSKTLTLSKTAVNNAFETSSGLADGSTSEEWLNLVATKPNWTISLS